MNFINLTLRKILQSIICVYLIINSLTAFSQSSNNSNSLNFLESILNNDDNDALNSNLDSFNNEADFENNGEIDRELLALIYEENKRENYLEKSYNDASSLNLQLQGYEFFATQMIFPRRLSVNNGGGSQDDKVLSTGDEIIIALQGPKNITYKKKVNNDGGVLIDFVGMVPVKGRKFGEVRKEIESRISETLLETKAFISLGKLKQINVIISGEVFKPGKHNLSSFSSIITALVKAGGIKKSGSLRQIKIYNNQKIYTIDLYDLLFGINPTIIKNIQLMEGAIIYVPKIGKTAAISGNIKQPGIYEILIGKTDLKEILRISGDQVTPGNSKYILQSFNSSGKSSFAGEVKKNYVVKNGDIIFLDFDYEDKSQSVQLVGEVKYPAYYSLKKYPTILSLFSKLDQFKKDTYLYSLIVKSEKNDENLINYKTYNLWNILKGYNDIKLYPNDEVFIFSYSDLNFLMSKEVLQTLKNNNKNSKNNRCKSIERLSFFYNSSKSAGFSEYDSIFKVLNNLTFENSGSQINNISINENNSTETANVSFASQSETIDIDPIKNNNFIDVQNKKEICPKIFEDNPELLLMLLDNIVLVRGSSKGSGIHLSSDDDNFEDLMKFIGIENSTFKVSPNKKIIDILSRHITLNGAVRFPSQVLIKNHSKLSSVLGDPDSFLDEAYLLFGMIERQKTDSSSKSNIFFSPESVINGESDHLLREGDIIKIFKNSEIKEILEKIEEQQLLVENNRPNEKNVSYLNNQNDQTNQEVKQIENYSDNKSLNKNTNNLNTLKDTKNIKDSIDKLNLGNQETKDTKANISKNKNNFQSETISNSFNPLLISDPLLEKVSQHLVEVKGEIIVPGKYPVGDKTKLSSFIEIIGGFTIKADKKNIEIIKSNSTKLDNKFIYPLSKVFVPSLNIEKTEIELSGAITNPRKIGYKNGLFLSEIIYSSLVLDKNAYYHFGIIERKSNEGIKIQPFSPSKVIIGDQNIKLQKSDKIIIFTNEEIEELLDEIESKGLILGSDIGLENGKVPSSSGALIKAASNLIVRLEGAVSNPSQYILAAKYSLREIIEISGGLSNNYDNSNIQLVLPSTDSDGSIKLITENLKLNDALNTLRQVKTGTTIRVPQKTSDYTKGTIKISGSVYQPGYYQIMRDDSIFDIIKRGGGLKDEAYIQGMVFTRIEELKREEASIKRLKRELEKAIAIALERNTGEQKIDALTINSIRELTISASNFKPIGRIVGNFANINTLKNTKVKKGDKIFIPSKPTSITVAGEVMTPGSLLWDKSKNSKDYILEAAGLTDIADKNKIFIISPNGKAQRASSLWSKEKPLFPGSTIVVPRKIELSSNLGRVSAITSVIYQLTLTFAGIDNLLSN